MTVVSLFAALVATITLVQGHFTFIRIAQNNDWKTPVRYIRNKTTPFEEPWTPLTTINTRLYNFPTYATDLPTSARCGRDNMAHANATETLAVRAGDTIEFAQQRRTPDEWTDAMWYNCSDGRGSCDPSHADVSTAAPGSIKVWLTSQGVMDINHPGPLIVHLSKVPDGQDISDYDGSGEWVKIFTLGLELRGSENTTFKWLPWNDQGIPGRFLFNIPEQTPAGSYLLRIDLLFPGIHTTAPAQLYPSCAQIVVESDYSGDLPKGIKIPEDISDTSPGVTVSIEMYRGDSIDDGYVYPGGLLWNGTDLIVDAPVV